MPKKNPIYARTYEQGIQLVREMDTKSREQRIQELIDTKMFINSQAEQQQGIFQCPGENGRQCILDANGDLYDVTGEKFDKKHKCCDAGGAGGGGTCKGKKSKRKQSRRKARKRTRKGKKSRRKARKGKRRRRRTKKH